MSSQGFTIVFSMDKSSDKGSNSTSAGQQPMVASPSTPSLLPMQPECDEKSLVEAIVKKDLALVTKLCTQARIPKNLNVDGHLCTPLLVAVGVGDLPLVKFFLAQGASLKESMTIEGTVYNSLTLAIKKGYLHLVEFFHKKYNISFMQKDNKMSTIVLALIQDQAAILRYMLTQRIFDKNTKILNLPMICYAIENGSFNAVKAIVEFNNSSVNSKDYDSQLLIFYAAMHCQQRMLEYFHRMDPSQIKLTSVHGSNMLHFAITSNKRKLGNLTDIEFIISKTGREILSQWNAQGLNPLHLCIQQHAQLDSNGEGIAMEIFLCLLKHGASPIDATLDGHTPLHLAVVENRLDMAKHLVSLKCDADEPNNRKITPLLTAVSKGSLEMIDLLLSAGANINYIVPGTEGYDAFACACEYGQMNVLKLFKERKYVFVSFNATEALALLIAQKDQAEVLKLLLDEKILHEKKDIYDFYRPNEGNLLHVAAEHGSLNIFKLLVEAYGMAIESSNYAGHSSFFIAAKQGHKGILGYILLKHPQYLHAIDKMGQTALHYAAQFSKVATVRYLLCKGAKVVTTITPNGVLPMRVKVSDSAKSKACQSIFSAVDEMMDRACNKTVMGRSLNELLQMGASLFQQDQDGKTPLHLAAEFGNTVLFEAMLASKDRPSLDCQDVNKNTPLDLAKGKPHYPKCVMIAYFCQAKEAIEKKEMQKIEIYFKQALEALSQISNMELLIDYYFEFWHKCRANPEGAPMNSEILIDRIFAIIDKSANSAADFLKFGKKLMDCSGLGHRAYAAFDRIVKNSASASSDIQKAHEYLSLLFENGSIDCSQIAQLTAYHSTPKWDEKQKQEGSLEDGLDLDETIMDQGTVQLHNQPYLMEQPEESTQIAKNNMEFSLMHLFLAGNGSNMIEGRTRKVTRLLDIAHPDNLGIDPCSSKGKLELLNLFRTMEQSHALELKEKESELAKRKERVFELSKENEKLKAMLAQEADKNSSLQALARNQLQASQPLGKQEGQRDHSAKRTRAEMEGQGEKTAEEPANKRAKP